MPSCTWLRPNDVRLKHTLFPIWISIALFLETLKLRSMLTSVEITIQNDPQTELHDRRLSAGTMSPLPDLALCTALIKSDDTDDTHG